MKSFRKSARTKTWLCSLLGCFGILALTAQSSAALSIVNAFPKGQVNDLAQITVIFDEPMQPLGDMRQPAASSPLRLTVADGQLPAGNFRWVDPSTLAYIFDAPVSHPLEITATVPKGTRSLAGTVLAKNFRWHVNTPPLSLSISNPHTLLPPESAVFYIYANYPLKKELLADKTRLSSKGKSVAFAISEPVHNPGYGGRPSQWHYVVSVKDRLPVNESLNVTIGQGVTAVGGGKASGEISAVLPTFRNLKLEKWQFNGRHTKPSPQIFPPEEPLELLFSNPVTRKDVLRHVSVFPNAELLSDPEESADYTSTFFRLPYLWDPRTQYTVTIAKGLADTYGTTLDKNESFVFTTDDYRPLAHIPGGHDAIIERPLGNAFPVTLRNAGTVTVSIHYVPWGKEALAVMRDDLLAPEKAIAGGREASIVLDVSDKPNQNIRELLDIPAALGFASAKDVRGLVTLYARASALDNARSHIRSHLQFTELGIAARLGEKNGLAWVVNLSSGKPVGDAEIRITDASGSNLWKGKTDVSGVAILPGYSKIYGARFCIAATGDDESVLDLGGFIVPASAKEYEKTKSSRIPWRAHVLSQLPLYQPGQEVNAILFIRRHDGDASLGSFSDWQAMPDTTVTLEVTDRRGGKIYTAAGKSNAYGSLPFSFTLPPGAEPGWYQVKVQAQGQESIAYAFQVASFRPPEFKVDVTQPSSQPIPVVSTQGKATNRLTATVNAGYFSGAVLDKGTVSLQVTEHETFFSPQRLRDYRVGSNPWPYFHPAAPRLTTIEGALDTNGSATLTLPDFDTAAGRAKAVELTATVTDTSRLTSQGTASFVLHPSEYYIGIRSPYIAMPGKATTIQLKAATWDDQSLTGKNVVFKAERTTYQNGKPLKTQVWERTVVLENPAGDSFEAVFASGGQYCVTATIADGFGRTNVASTQVYVPGGGGDWVQTSPGRHLEFIHEETVYHPGQTARIMVKNPFENGATALVAVERDGIIRQYVSEVSGAAPLIEVPLEKADAPYVYSTVTLIKGRTAAPPDANPTPGAADEGAPTFAQGTVLLKVAGAREQLSVTVTSDAKEYRPGDTVNAMAQVTNGAGEARKTQVTFLAVDERYLRAAGDDLRYDPTTTFSEQFPNMVMGTDMWRFILNRAVPLSIIMERKAYARVASPTAPMRDMATAAGEPDGEDVSVRSDFTPLVFWLAQGETDRSGKLPVSFTLPDTVTGYRIVAVASDAKSAFNVGMASITASKPLQILSALPKFVTQGDRILAPFLVQNTSKLDGTVTVNARLAENVTGISLDTDSQEVIIPAGQSKRVSVTVKIASTAMPRDTVQMDISATMKTDATTETDRALFTFALKPALPLTTVAVAGHLKEGETFVLPVKTPGNPDPRSRLDVTVAPSPAAGAPLAAKQVVTYPWNCLEQRMSRSWARILRLQHGSLLGLPPDATDREKIAAEFATVPSYQSQGGSFSLWPGLNSPENALFLTSYVLLVHASAKELGLTLPEETTGKALEYIARQLDQLPSPGTKPTGQKNTLATSTHPSGGTYSGSTGRFSESPDAVALALRVLAVHDPVKAKTLFARAWEYAEQGEMNPLGLASFLLTIDATKDISGAPALIAAIREKLEKTAAVTATEMHFASAHSNSYWRTLGSSLRDNAYTLGALASTTPAYPRLEGLARWVGQRLGDMQTLSTQESVFGMWGLAIYLQSLGGDQKVSMTADWNGVANAHFSFTRLMDAPKTWTFDGSHLNTGENSSLKVTATSGRPYWTARLAYVSDEPETSPENAGFTITRSFGTKAHGTWKVGDVSTVTLTVIVPATRRHVVLFDPFPAGFEPLFASRVDVAQRGKTWQPPWQWQDALEDGMLLYAPVVHPGTYTFTYEVRATAGGTFIQRPAVVEEMYTPETFGRTGASSLTVAE